jgi:hypothetical protein
MLNPTVPARSLSSLPLTTSKRDLLTIDADGKPEDKETSSTEKELEIGELEQALDARDSDVTSLYAGKGTQEERLGSRKRD